MTLPDPATTISRRKPSWSDDPAPLKAPGLMVWHWIGPGISIGIIVAALFSLRTLHWRNVIAVMPTSLAFWAVFAAFYVTPIAADWAIYRYLWHIPASGFIALARKQIRHKLLPGHVGEIHFYTWARKTLAMRTSPFGAMMDVATLSALVGSAVTLVMIAITYPLMTRLEFATVSHKLHGSALILAALLGIVVGAPVLAALFRKRLFSLTREQLLAVSAIHCVRILVGMSLAGLGWALALPQVALSWWVVLLTVRLVISRLPLVTHKDIVFAGIAVIMAGRDLEMAALIAIWTASYLLGNLAIGAALEITAFITPVDRR